MTLNTAIKSWQIQPATISGGHLAVSNSVSGTQVLSYDSSEDSFKWDYLATVTINEVPSGDIDGSNKEFTLSNTPLEDSERVYLNGLLQEPGSGKDYTIDGNKITFTIAPESGDVVLVSYLIEQASKTSIPYGFACGGWNEASISTINRILFPFDSGTAEFKGNLASSRAGGAGFNSSMFGFAATGIALNLPYTSTIERFVFPFDSGTSSIVGTIDTVARETCGGINCSSYGYIVGGDTWRISGTDYSYIDRVQFPFDSGSSTVCTSHLDTHRRYCFGLNSSSYGYTGGYPSQADIVRFLFPFLSGNAVVVGSLANGIRWREAVNSSTYGYIYGGGDGWISSSYSYIDRILFPFDSGTATYVGNLSFNVFGARGANSTEYGYVFGGFPYPSARTSAIQRFQFPFDSGTASHVGNLTYNAESIFTIDGTDFVSIFI